MLPGTNRAADRFARMSYYVDAAGADRRPAPGRGHRVSIMRNVSVPIGITVEVSPTSPIRSGSRSPTRRTWSTTTRTPIAPASSGRTCGAGFQRGVRPRRLQLDGNPDLAATRRRTSSRPNFSSSCRPTSRTDSGPNHTRTASGYSNLRRSPARGRVSPCVLQTPGTRAIGKVCWRAVA